MICGTVNGVSGLSIGIVAVAIFSTVAWILIATPIKVMAFRQRYDTWLTTKIPLLAVILRPWHRVESQLTTLGAGALDSPRLGNRCRTAGCVSAGRAASLANQPVPLTHVSIGHRAIC